MLNNEISQKPLSYKKKGKGNSENSLVVYVKRLEVSIILKIKN